jgi:EpsD family peptidyl-prolyl cis-trans isomerase
MTPSPSTTIPARTTTAAQAPFKHRGTARWLACLGAATLLGLSGCGNKDAATAASQVAAKVGSDEISVHQINEALTHSTTQGATKQEINAISRSVLEKLIDQQLALNQAIDAKLNRSPEVVTQIESSRREILAAAWIKQLANTLPRPTEAETRQYFTEHPYLFSQRRVFHVQEIVVPTQSAQNTPTGQNAQPGALATTGAAAIPGIAGIADVLRDYATNGKSLQDAAAWLKSREVAFTGGETTRAAEQIPLETLPQIAALKDGQTTVVETPTTLTLMRLVSSDTAPVAESQALPRIAQFMMNQRITNAVAANLKEMRSTTKVQYLGEFAAAPSSAPETKVVALSSPIQPDPSAAQASRKVLEKGVASLK